MGAVVVLVVRVLFSYTFIRLTGIVLSDNDLIWSDNEQQQSLPPHSIHNPNKPSFMCLECAEWVHGTTTILSMTAQSTRSNINNKSYEQ